MTVPFPGAMPPQSPLTSLATSDWANAIALRAPAYFASVAARSAAIPTPTVGMLSVITTGADAGLYQWNGTIWSGMAYAGAFTTFTPAVTGWTLGNGSVGGAYQLEGKKLTVVQKVLVGSSTSGTALTLGIPAGMTWKDALMVAGAGQAVLAGATFGASCVGFGTATVRAKYDANNFNVASQPGVWAAGDTCSFTTVGEIA